MRSSHRIGFVFCAAIVVSSATRSGAADTPATGPLRVHPANPRFFTDGTKTGSGSLRAVYLTGAHTWDNFQDMTEAGGKPFDFDGHLDFLQRHGHNFTRGWRGS